MPSTPTGEQTPTTDHYAEELKRIGVSVMDDPEKKLSVQPSAEMIDAATRIGLNPIGDMAGVQDALHEDGLDAAHRYVDGITPQYEPELGEKIIEAIAENERVYGPSFRLDAAGREKLASIRDSVRRRVQSAFHSQPAEALKSDTGSAKNKVLVTVAIVAVGGLLVAPTISNWLRGIDQQNKRDEAQDKKEAFTSSVIEAAKNYSEDEIFVGSGTVGPDGGSATEVGQAILERNELPVDPADVDFDRGTFETSAVEGPGIVQPGEEIDVVLERVEGSDKYVPIVQNGDLNPRSSTTETYPPALPLDDGQTIPAPKTH